MSWRRQPKSPAPRVTAPARSLVPIGSAWPAKPRCTAAATTDSASAIATMKSEVMPFSVRLAAGRDGTHRRAVNSLVMLGRPVTTLVGRPLSLPSTTVIPVPEGDFVAKPRIRTIKPEMWQDRDFMALPLLGKLTFLCLIQHADDEGRLDSDAQHLSDAWLHVPSEEVQPMLDILHEREMITRYIVKGRPYLALCGWSDHQKVDHPRPSNYPPPPPKRNSKSSRTLANVRAEHQAPPTPPLANHSEKPLTDPDPEPYPDPDRERSPIPTARRVDEPLEKQPEMTREQEAVGLRIVSLGIRRLVRERTNQALEFAKKRGANNPAAYLSGSPESGRVTLLEDLAIGWREEDNRERKEQEGGARQVREILPSVFLPTRSA